MDELDLRKDSEKKLEDSRNSLIDFQNGFLIFSWEKIKP